MDVITELIIHITPILLGSIQGDLLRYIQANTEYTGQHVTVELQELQVITMENLTAKPTRL